MWRQYMKHRTKKCDNGGEGLKKIINNCVTSFLDGSLNITFLFYKSFNVWKLIITILYQLYCHIRTIQLCVKIIWRWFCIMHFFVNFSFFVFWPLLVSKNPSAVDKLCIFTVVEKITFYFQWLLIIETDVGQKNYMQ